jgi:hypothetical protein
LSYCSYCGSYNCVHHADGGGGCCGFVIIIAVLGWLFGPPSAPPAPPCDRVGPGVEMEEEADLNRCDLSGKDLTRAHLVRAKLIAARLVNATLIDVNLTEADLTDAKLSGADLTRAILAGAELTRASLAGANLTDADLEGANLEGADLRGAIEVSNEDTKGKPAHGPQTPKAGRARGRSRSKDDARPRSCSSTHGRARAWSTDRRLRALRRRDPGTRESKLLRSRSHRCWTSKYPSLGTSLTADVGARSASPVLHPGRPSVQRGSSQAWVRFRLAQARQVSFCLSHVSLPAFVAVDVL